MDRGGDEVESASIAIYRNFASSSADHQFFGYCSVDGIQLRFEVGSPDSKLGSNIKVGVSGSVIGVREEVKFCQHVQ